MKNFAIDLLSIDKEIKDFIKNQKDITIDKYSTKGGNAELFFGNHNILKKRVALKFYYIDKSDFAHKEAQILAKLNDKNILPVYDAKKVSKNYAYFLTPEIIGGDLDSYMNKRRVDIFRTLHIVKGILKALTVLHKDSNRLVHRDLKPANILVGANDVPIIADFGSIKVMPENKNFIQASQHSFIYRPPEAIDGKKFYFESDIYQVGLILYQMLGGFFPYLDVAWLSQQERKKYALLDDDYYKTQFFNKVVGDKIINGRLLKLNTLPVYICRKLKHIINKATNVDVTKRYRTSSEFMKDIHSYFADAVNWYCDKDEFVAVSKGGLKLRVIDKNNQCVVKRQCKNKKWQIYNRIQGSLPKICKKINSIK